MGLSTSAQKAIALRIRRPYQQFGQNADLTTAGGATGCTHTCLQFLAELWGKGFYTHDQISRIAGYPSQASVAPSSRRGMRPSEVQAFCDRIGLPYKVRLGLTPTQVLAAAQLAPVGFGHVYGWVPEWKGYRYAGITADGRPNGFAAPSSKAGKTQLTGFERGAHFAVVLGAGQGATSYQVYAMEPNHGSASRPEKPPYDIYTLAQFNALYTSYQRVLGRTPYALVATRPLP